MMYKSFVLPLLLVVTTVLMVACAADGCTVGYKVKANDNCTPSSPFYNQENNGAQPTTPPTNMTIKRLK